jgi:hypothetical protein
MAFTTYWITFHIKDQKTTKGSYGDRYAALINALQEINDGWWAQPTSFILFGSEQPRANIIARLKKALDTSVDVAVIGEPHFKVFDVVGAVSGFDAVQSMVDFAKKV